MVIVQALIILGGLLILGVFFILLKEKDKLIKLQRAVYLADEETGFLEILRNGKGKKTSFKGEYIVNKKDLLDTLGEARDRGEGKAKKSVKRTEEVLTEV